MCFFVCGHLLIAADDIAVNELFTCLDGLEQILDKQRYLIGDELTEADIRLFVTLIRFDVVYVCTFSSLRQKLVVVLIFASRCAWIALHARL